ncbi:DUF262 domain-containing HNH endonuclease family protein [Aureispira anguillae]|uniref:DUF262 domain-containing HNH endonuclease familyprotein n=1 Tax=Aureispira anguillae TaxID=2864201 RepID=A0A915YGL9_9BACT|nr:DUF262 domain-containing HNH endonuclease family protein [Aureispira anguillae]BDS12778.1 DUF262 domain-containing HNH endonuclease familyprotein [Aureispira anguillae]
MESRLDVVPVGKLLAQEDDKPKYQFFIPDYQRGYRWEYDQVVDLLEDILEFINTSEKRDDKYCLQPIVVKRMQDGRYEVLDGQQRLTTIFIILSRLKKSNSDIDLFSLEYKTRPDSGEFLRHLDEKVKDEDLCDKNPDYHYISTAYNTIDAWIKKTKNIKPNITTKLFDAIAESLEFIWYEVVTSQYVDAIDIFTRINIGKIPLTNAELVKAVFLSKNNLSIGFASLNKESDVFKDILTLKQNAIALEWDLMEKKLQDPSIWGFVYGGKKDYETRVDYIMDLCSHKQTNEKNKYFSFKYFYDKVKAIRSNKEELKKYAESNTSFIEQEWNDLKKIFDILIEWYHDKTYNHLIGLLIYQNYPIIEIIDEFITNNRKVFLANIKSKIRELINIKDISKLRYGTKGQNEKIDTILKVHNIINSLQVQDKKQSFPFEKLKNKSWTLEHIFAQNSDDLREDDYVNWLNDHLSFFKAKLSPNNEVNVIIVKIENLLSLEENKIPREGFEECFKVITDYIQKQIAEIDNLEAQNDNDEDISLAEEDEYEWINDDHSIANLALLDGKINSALKNSLFDIKRKLILEKDKAGLYIPSETKKVFLKYYTPTPNHLAYWTYNDRKAYIESIKSSLEYLN